MKTRSVDVKCQGCGVDCKPVLSVPIDVQIKMEKYGEYIIVGPENCPHTCGNLGQGCKASQPDQDSVAVSTLCKFSFDYPDACKNAHWQVPSELKDTISELDKA